MKKTEMEASSHSHIDTTTDDDDDSIYSKDNDETIPLTTKTPRYCCGITPWLCITTLVCIYGSSFQFGYNIAVVNAPEKVRYLRIQSYKKSLCNTSY